MKSVRERYEIFSSSFFSFLCEIHLYSRILNNTGGLILFFSFFLLLYWGGLNFILKQKKKELLPFLTEGVDDEDEVLLAMASSLGKLVTQVGGGIHAHNILPPLEELLSVGMYFFIN